MSINFFYIFVSIQYCVSGVYWQLLCGEYDHEYMQIIDNQFNVTTTK